MKKDINLRRQFVVKENKLKKRFEFNAQTNRTNSYSISFSDCDNDENNAWISISLAVKKARPNLILSSQ